jgi:ABC-2 type transport system permease protein
VVEQLLRLKLRLLGNSFRRSPWQIVAISFGLLSGLLISFFVFTTLVGLRLVAVSIAEPPVVLFGALVVLGFLVVPLVFGVDDVLDPRKFSLYGIPTDELAKALAIAALIGISPLVMTLISLGQVVTWARNPLAVLLGVISLPVIVATSLLCSRVSTSAAAFVLSSRKSRDGAGILGVVVLVIVAAGIVALFRTNWQQNGLNVLDGISGFLSWTPLGAAWAGPADAAGGNFGPALLKELIALATVGTLWLAWRYLVKVMLVTQPRMAEARRYRELGMFRVTPSSPTGVIAGRTFTYWVRDARYHASLIVIPVIPFMLMLPFLVIGIPTHYLALFPVPVMAMFLGWSVHNDTAYDHTAIWLHIASGTRGRADRLGRVIPPLLVGTVVIIVASIICASLYGSGRILPALLGVGLGVLFTGLGLSSVGSALFPYPAVRPGDSPFAAPQAVGSASALIQSLSFVVTFILVSPTLILAVLALLEPGGWNWGALIVGLGLGALLLWAGIAGGGAIFDRRAPEILGASVRN